MKVIFLDFDGVVCCLPVEWTKLPSGRQVHALNRAAVGRLNNLVAATGAKVVVSSSWRHHHSVLHLAGYLERAGFVGTVVGVTPDLRSGEAQRGEEVAAFLAANLGITSYVVIDDDMDMGPIPRHRWTYVSDGWRLGGLQDAHVVLAAAALGLPVEVTE